jgi:hypothetical protein
MTSCTCVVLTTQHVGSGSSGPLSLSGFVAGAGSRQTCGQVAGPPPSVSRRHASGNDWLRLAASVSHQPRVCAADTTMHQRDGAGQNEEVTLPCPRGPGVESEHGGWSPVERDNGAVKTENGVSIVVSIFVPA